MVKIRKNNGMTSEWIIVPAPDNILSTVLVISYIFYRDKDIYYLSNSPIFQFLSLNMVISHYLFIPITILPISDEQIINLQPNLNQIKTEIECSY